MSISEKQLAANRANAKKSTGPKSQEGKNRARLNGCRHGLTGMGTVMTDEDHNSKTNFVEPYVEELAAVGHAEINLAETIATDAWRLVRLRAVEDNTFADGHFNEAGNFSADHYEVHNAITQARVFSLEHATFATLSLYEQRITRNFHKNLKLFFELRDGRKAPQRKEGLLEAEAIPLTRTAAATSEQNGFEFSFSQLPVPAAQKQAPEVPQTPPVPVERAA